jgi:ATP-dependent Clp protease ATP-binding subunit ClpC
VLVVRVLLVSGSAPGCVGESFRHRSPLDRFTESAREVVARAREAAFELGHGNVGPEHILLGLLRRPDGVTAQALRSLDITLERVRAQVVKNTGPAQQLPLHRTPSSAPFTPRGMQVLELASIEASRLDDLAEPHHVLLALVHDNEGPAARVLRECSADPDTIRNKVISLLE